MHEISRLELLASHAPTKDTETIKGKGGLALMEGSMIGWHIMEVDTLYT